MKVDPRKKFGMNRTGKNTSPLLSKVMVSELEELTNSPPGDSSEIARNRVSMMKDSDGLGSIPVPTTFKGLLKTGVQMLENNHPEVLIDKLGERLAIERTGERIYEGLISKFQADESRVSNVVSLERLQEIHNEERQHFLLPAETIENMGADPTAITPSADVAAMTSMGIVKVLSDPRINFIQSLDAVLVAELSDNDCWKHLIALTTQAGLSDIAAKFEECYKNEQEHLETIRRWVAQFGLRTEPQSQQEVA